MLRDARQQIESFLRLRQLRAQQAMASSELV